MLLYIAATSLHSSVVPGRHTVDVGTAAASGPILGCAESIRPQRRVGTALARHRPNRLAPRASPIRRRGGPACRPFAAPRSPHDLAARPVQRGPAVRRNATSCSSRPPETDVRCRRPVGRPWARSTSWRYRTSMALSAPSATALEGSAQHGHQFVGRPFLADVEDRLLDCGPPWPVKLVHSPVDRGATVDLRAYRGRNPALSVHHELDDGRWLPDQPVDVNAGPSTSIEAPPDGAVAHSCTQTLLPREQTPLNARNGGELLLRARRRRSAERPAFDNATGHGYEPAHRRRRESAPSTGPRAWSGATLTP